MDDSIRLKKGTRKGVSFSTETDSENLPGFVGHLAPINTS